jgi:splicing factor U2AF subunit
MANQALQLNGIPFLGAVLKVSRPSKYAGPVYPTKTWQELTGQTLPMGAVLDASAEEKVARELFVGNTTPEMTELALRDFLGNAMMQVGLTEAPGNPITACRLSGKFAFIELRSPSEARKALNLNNIPFMGVQLRVGRPSKWNGPPDANVGNWEDILAKHLSGELQVGVANTNFNQANMSSGASPGAAAATTSSMPQAAVSATPPSRVVELKNMLSMDDLQNDDEYQDILADTEEECRQFGQLLKVVIPKRDEPGATKIFLEYATTDDAAVAISKLAGRTFDGKKVLAAYYDQEQFNQQQYE